MIIRTPSLLDHLDQVITVTHQSLGPIASITMPVWMQQSFVNEAMAMLAACDPYVYQDLEGTGTCRYRGIEINFHDGLDTKIKLVKQ